MIKGCLDCLPCLELELGLESECLRYSQNLLVLRDFCDAFSSTLDERLTRSPTARQCRRAAWRAEIMTLPLAPVMRK